MRVTGGKSVYGASVGILMLDARFPRIPGDMGNATTWPFPVLYRVVAGASPEKVVLNGATGLLQDFVAAATDLVDLGAEAITTNCGFLSLYQVELARHVGVPAGKTFRYTPDGPLGLLPPGKRAIIAVARGGNYTNGKQNHRDYQVPYLREILKFIGITDVTFILAEGLNISPEERARVLERTSHEVDTIVARMAAATVES